MLADITGAGIVHMDDFFLPGSLRTEERLSQPGGNIHYERFLADAAHKLPSSKEFGYQAFDCRKMRMGEEKKVKESRWRIVEGSYSCHPALNDYMHLRVFCDIKPENQLQRIIKRNGNEMAAVFKERWIPLEELYFNTFLISEKADIVFVC